MRYQVADGTQIHHDGVTYSAGEVLDAEDDVAAPWLRSEWVTVVSEPEKPRRRAKP